MSSPANFEIIKDFIAEVDGYIPTLLNGLQSLKNGAEPGQVLEESHRLAHTIKGASSLVGLKGLGQIAFQMEGYLEDLIAGKCEYTEDTSGALQQTVEMFREYCTGYLKGGVASRAMLRTAAEAFCSVRGLSNEAHHQALNDLLASVPETEGHQAPADSETEQNPATVNDPHDPYPAEFRTGGESGMVGGILPPEEHFFGANEDEVITTASPVKAAIDLPPELLEGFYEEAEEHLEDLRRSLRTLESQVKEAVSLSPAMREEIRRVRRSVHTLKGAAAVIGLSDFATYAHSLEDLLDWLYEEAGEITPAVVALLTESSDLLERIIADPQTAHCTKAESLKAQYQKLLTQKRMDGAGVSKVDPDDGEQTSILELNEILQAEKASSTDRKPSEAEYRPPADEAENKAPAGTRFAKTLRVNMERFDNLVNLAGELIITLSAFDQKMETFNGAVTDLELYRERIRQIARDLEVSYEVKALERLQTLPDEIQKADFADFDTLELDRYSELNLIIRKLNESAVDVGALHTQLSHLYSDFDGRLTRQRVVLSELQDKMMRARMTPISIITDKLRRTVREVAANLDKKVELVITGEDIELDKHVWEKIADPLMHLLRNAADHGIESQTARKSAGKPPVATIRLEAFRSGNQVVLRIADDGAGLDFPAIRATVRKLKLSDRADEMSEQELSQYIFYPGFSTRDAISEISGRGVGMDVVKESIQNLKGVIHVTSRKAQGTQFTIRIPLTLAAVRALIFTACGRTYAVALNEISEIIRMNPADIMGPDRDALRLKDEVLPLFYMADLLNPGKKDAQDGAKAGNPVTLVVDTGGRRGALVIDSLAGQKEIVIKNLGSHLRYVKGISGATIMGDGSVIPILNLDELLWSRDTIMETGRTDGDLRPQKELSMMVVDDSVSIRQVVSRLLESQGWKVMSAKDGLEAFDRLRDSRPDLIVLDIEMPRMNGFEFLSAFRAQAVYQDIPVIMLTSRAAAKHRDKARALGADGFMIKPYNDEKFINLILKLTSRGSA